MITHWRTVFSMHNFAAAHVTHTTSLSEQDEEKVWLCNINLLNHFSCFHFSCGLIVDYLDLIGVMFLSSSLSILSPSACENDDKWCLISPVTNETELGFNLTPMSLIVNFRLHLHSNMSHVHFQSFVYTKAWHRASFNQSSSCQIFSCSLAQQTDWILQWYWRGHYYNMLQQCKLIPGGRKSFIQQSHIHIYQARRHKEEIEC